MKTLSSSVAFQDEAGNVLANGSIVITLPYGIYEIAAGGGQVVGQSLIINLDATGKIPGTPRIWASDELNPQTPYTVSLCLLANGVQPFASATWLIAGASPIDLSLMVNTSAAAVSFPAATLQRPASNQSIVQPAGTNLSVNRFQQYRFADQFPASDMGASIALAIADLPATGGTVDCTAFPGDNIVTSGTIVVGSATKPVKLILPAGRIISTANPVISVAGASFIVGISPSASSIVYNGVNNDGILWTGSHGGISNLLLTGGPNSRHGLVLQSSGSNGVACNEFRSIRMAGNPAAGTVGLRLISDSASALTTLNKFYGLKIWDFDINIKFETTGAQGSTNNFLDAIEIQSSTGLGTAGISIVSGDINFFSGVFIAGKAIGISTTAGVKYNQFERVRLESNTTNINNAGTGTQFEIFSLDANTITDSGPDTVILGITGNVSFTQKKGSNPLGGLVPNVQAFTASGTFTIPAGITAVKATIIAGGGAGGGASTTTWGTGGGSGGTGIKYLSGLTPGNTITVTVGSGGTGVASATGNAGGDSTIASGTQTITTVTAKGGRGGVSVGGQNPGGAGGAAGTNGDINAGGQPGGINTANSLGGNGAPSTLGGGGNGPGPNTVGNAGTAPGAGGSGSSETSSSTSAGGAGANGIVIFEWVN